MQPSPTRQRRPAGRSLDNGGHEDGGEQLLAKMKEKNRSAQRRYRERIKVSLQSATEPLRIPGIELLAVCTAVAHVVSEHLPGHQAAPCSPARTYVHCCAVTVGGKRRTGPRADSGRGHAEGSEGNVPLNRCLMLTFGAPEARENTQNDSNAPVVQDALSARNDLLERLLAMQEQQAQQNTNSIVETEEVRLRCRFSTTQ